MKGKRETKAAVSVVVDITDNIVTGIASVMGVKDFGADIILNGAFKRTIKQRLDKIRFLWQHDSFDPPLATIKRLEEVGKDDLPKQILKAHPEATGGLLVEREYLPTTRGMEILAGVKSDPPAIREMSIGYDAVKVTFEGDDAQTRVRKLHEVRLWDISDVNWGMNEATVAAIKSVIPFKETPKLDDTAAWDAEAEIKDAEVSDLRYMCVLHDNEDTESKEAYKLPHHKKDGKYHVVWNGVRAAMAELFKTRDIAECNRKEIYDHLAEHYKQFGKDAPDYELFKMACDANAMIDSKSVDEGIVRPLINRVETLLSLGPAGLSPEPLTGKDVFNAIKIRNQIMERMI